MNMKEQCIRHEPIASPNELVFSFTGRLDDVERIKELLVKGKGLGLIIYPPSLDEVATSGLCK